MDDLTTTGDKILRLSKKDKKSFKKTVFLDKLNNPWGIAFFILLAVCIGFGMAQSGAAFGAIFIVILVTLPAVYAIVVYPKIGIIILLVMAYLLFGLSRIGINGPIGVLIDALQFLLFIGLLINLKKEQNLYLLKGPVSVMILIWIGYNVLEVLNPVTAARGAWIYTIRSVAIVLLTYFVFLYNIRSIQFVRLIFKIWIGVAFVVALYTFKQEYIGFSDSELAYLYSDPSIMGLLFIGGHWRKFSLLSDPVSLAYNMTMASIFCLALIWGETTKKFTKCVLAFLFVMFQLASAYSGTRGANVLLPAALILFAILNYSRKMLIFMCGAAVFLVILINIPTGNQNLARFQTAFRPNNDQSYKLRKYNQKRIQPYIQTHPMGGGLGSVGTWGAKFDPGSLLGTFQPDSGYIRVAVELGWIGLLLFCTMMFTMMRQGINNYYLIKDPELKNYCLALTLIIFAYNIANFPQEALVQFPSNVYFSLDVALVSVLLRLDKEKQEQTTIAPAA